MGVKKCESGKNSTRVRERLFMRGETESWGMRRRRGIRKSGRKSSLMVEKTNDDVMHLIGPWILGDECDHTST